eukprot:343596-Chlamydomonas_euryale.AAC.7
MCPSDRNEDRGCSVSRLSQDGPDAAAEQTADRRIEVAERASPIAAVGRRRAALSGARPRTTRACFGGVSEESTAHAAEEASAGSVSVGRVGPLSASSTPSTAWLPTAILRLSLRRLAERGEDRLLFHCWREEERGARERSCSRCCGVDGAVATATGHTTNPTRAGGGASGAPADTPALAARRARFGDVSERRLRRVHRLLRGLRKPASRASHPDDAPFCRENPRLDRARSSSRTPAQRPAARAPARPAPCHPPCSAAQLAAERKQWMALRSRAGATARTAA